MIFEGATKIRFKFELLGAPSNQINSHPPTFSRMVLQLQGIAGQIRSRVDSVLNNVKKSASSTPLDPDDRTPEEMQPNDSERTSKIIDSVMSTLFAACTGNNCPTDEATLVDSLQKKQPTKLGEKARNALHTLQHSSSRDECHYAQFYDDDQYRVAAKAVLLARERESRERSVHRQKLHDLRRDARAEAQHKISSQHRENGNPYRLSDVLNHTHLSEDSESALSYNFDDGISAISAHTLEEMAKAELILQRKRGILQNERFDTALGPTKGSLPPSPTSTVDSSNASFEEDGQLQGPVHSQEDVVQKEKSDEDPKTNYPVQMARPRSNRSTDLSATSSNSEFMEWQNHDSKYWSQVAEKDIHEAENEPVSQQRTDNLS